MLVAQADSVFSGISTFGRLPFFPCLASEDEKYDIAFLGILPPFFTASCWLLMASTTQALRLIPGLLTDQGRGSGLVVSDKVLAV